jgi:hypothetical protein
MNGHWYDINNPHCRVIANLLSLPHHFNLSNCVRKHIINQICHLTNGPNPRTHFRTDREN